MLSNTHAPMLTFTTDVPSAALRVVTQPKPDPGLKKHPVWQNLLAPVNRRQTG